MKKLFCALLALTVLFVCCACTRQPCLSTESGAETIHETQQSASLTTEATESTAISTTEPPGVLFTAIDHYVMSESQKYYAEEEMKAAYPAFVDALLYERPEVVELTDDYDCNLALWSAFRESPYYFLIADYAFTDNHTASKVTYAYSAEEQAQRIAYIDNEYLTMLNACITPDMTELEKVLSVYHYFGTRIDYDYRWLEEMHTASEQWLYPEIVIYEALQTNLGVCHSYSYLMQFAMQQLGIPCWCVSGDMADRDEGHMWNIIMIDGQTYHCDLTWDSSNVDDTVGLRYFGMTDEERLAGGVSENYKVSIDAVFDGLPCTSTLLAAIRDVTEYRLLGTGQLAVQRNYESQWETVALPQQ